jgi:hypothetical protein
LISNGLLAGGIEMNASEAKAYHNAKANADADPKTQGSPTTRGQRRQRPTLMRCRR